ncbi:MAG: hypothetical protein LBJ67_15990 [Planctomycetaceae bacterium]|jgi:hypothetical protein|nr:hypothetical protein [Planctomycetaceae bacterium]
MENVPKNKVHLTPASSYADRETLLTRRTILKWSLVGGLIAMPIGLTAYRKVKDKDNSYQYIYQGPIEEGEPTPQVKVLGGTGWYKDYDVSQWSGERSGKIYTPESMYVNYSGDFHPLYAIGLTLCVSDSAPEGQHVEITLDAMSKGRIILTDSGVWINSCPEWKENEDDEWRIFWGPPTKPTPSLRLSFYKEEFLLDRIDRLVITIKERRFS